MVGFIWGNATPKWQFALTCYLEINGIFGSAGKNLKSPTRPTFLITKPQVSRGS